MPKRKQLLPALAICFFILPGYAQVYDQALEQQREATKTVFSQLISDVSDYLTDSALSIDQQHELFTPMLAYANDKQTTLMDIRNVHFRQAGPPPAAVADLRYDSLADSTLIHAFQDTRFTTISMMQCYRPAEVAGLVEMLVQPGIYQAAALAMREAGISYTFGHQVFAENLQDEAWRLWYANRGYVVRFDLNLSDMTVSDVAYTIPNSVEYRMLDLPFTHRQQRFEVDRLYQELDGVRWDTYSEALIRDADPARWEDAVNQALHTYYNENEARFVRVQTELLARLARGEALGAGWVPIDGLTANGETSLQQALQPFILQPDEAAQVLFSMCNTMSPFNEDFVEISKNAIVGFKHYIQGHVDDAWQVLSVGHTIAFSYSWDVESATFSALKVFRKTED